MRSAEVLRERLSSDPVENLGFIACNYDENPTVSVRTEMFYFMRGYYNPFDFPAENFLKYDNQFHNFVYDGRGFDISRI